MAFTTGINKRSVAELTLSFRVGLCHNIFIEDVSIKIEILNKNSSIKITSSVKSESKTGVEMEALCGVNAGLLCAWDMLKSVEKDANGQYPAAQIDEVRVLRKSKGDPHD